MPKTMFVFKELLVYPRYKLNQTLKMNIRVATSGLTKKALHSLCMLVKSADIKFLKTVRHSDGIPGSVF